MGPHEIEKSSVTCDEQNRSKKNHCTYKQRVATYREGSRIDQAQHGTLALA